jgi:NitT/TauT family transport system permease protein
MTDVPSSSRARAVGSWLLPLAVPLAFIALWEGAIRFGHYSNVLVPPPSVVFVTLWGMIRDGTLLENVGASLQRVAVGYVLSVIVGVPIGLAMGYSRLMDRLLGSTVNGLRPIPASAWIPISIILMGIGERPAVFLVFIGTVWSIVLNSGHGVRSVPKHLIWAAQTMGASRTAIFTKVIFPASLPSIFTGMRVAVGVAFTCVIVAELIAVRSGLGYLITEARMIVRSDIVIAGMIAIGMVGLLLDLGVRMLMKRALRWQRGLVAESTT